MSSDSMWKAYDLFAKAFQTFWAFPIEWNPTIRRVQLVDFNSRKLLPWKVITPTAIIYGFGFSLLILLHEVFSTSEPNRMYILECLIISASAGIYSGASLLIILYGKQGTNGFNELFKLEQDLIRVTPKQKSKKSLDIVGLFMCGIVLKIASIPYFFTLFRLYKGVKSLQNNSLLQNIVSAIAPQGSWGNAVFLGLILTIKLTVAFTATMEVCRLICGLLLALISGLKILKKCLFLLNYFQEGKLNAGCDHFNRIRLTVVLGRIPLHNGTAGIMIVGTLLSVCCNYASIKMYKVIPILLYLFTVSLALFIPIVIAQTLPQAIKVHEASNELLRSWRVGNIGRSELRRKYLAKKVRSIRPLAFYAGIGDCDFFMLVQSTKRTFYWVITDYTITALLTL